jgi:hypothetical protein
MKDVLEKEVFKYKGLSIPWRGFPPFSVNTDEKPLKYFLLE